MNTLPYRQIPDHYYQRSTSQSPYYHRHCAGCSNPAEGTGVDFTTLDPDRKLCNECETKP